MSTPEYLDFIDPYLKLANWRLHFCILPKKSIISDKILWLTYVYKGTRIISMIENRRLENYFMSSEEYLIWRLTSE